ncbi:MAG: PAS domain-containing protein [Sulfuricurvum sp.]|uniref:PAS domain-containing protein n=1 Tax=Sulfuricurvum sp. TaxID=2025608 RepID=UPI00260B87CB|nr:PAS domain-containing protein [Sulfuricurvum sp.]MDD2828429.1 PAS domain-containing protein [Sulfuricurvum sp.]MDD4949434.1 PAS domain-containing protein [Sulfuricurvum sp.]
MQRPTPTDVEIKFEGGNMITETDLNGKIVYVNRLFTEMSGYSKEELIGKPHSLIRHPDMPKCCFRSMWDTVKAGNPWEGYVKNLRKDGAFYWVVVTVTPKYNDANELCGFIAVRKPPGELTLQEIKEKYTQMIESEACMREENIYIPATFYDDDFIAVS